MIDLMLILNQKGFLSFIVLIVLLIILGAAFFVYKQYSSSVDFTSSDLKGNRPISIALPSPSIKVTSFSATTRLQSSSRSALPKASPSVSLISPSPTLTPSGATLALNPASGNIGRGCDLSLEVEAHTNGLAIQSGDVVLKYDPTKLTFTSVTQISEGKTFTAEPNSQNSSAGRATSSFSYSSLGFTGTDKPLIFKFKVYPNAALGPTNIAFDFDPENPTKTSDSNLVEARTVAEKLTSVSDSTFNIGTNSCN